MKRVGGPYNQGATMGLNLKLKGVVGVLAGQEAGPSKTSWTTEEESPSCDGGMDLEESPRGHYDRSGNAGVEPQFEVPLCVVPSEGSEENVIGCWALVENNGGSTMYRDEEWGPGLNDPQAERGEKEERWEESSLAKFSHFLGFSTEGLEKEILDFLTKIRKRRERIHDKVLLEKSKFERELKRLECSVNYEKGRKQKDPPKGKGCHLSVLQ
ncbi:hypothetical protein CK203_106342 [Vitis vinifera]|uniref:Uncharacterized protein n=1 Tax=Vitis vinifera TaxID=29760 RepID=A0A438BNZ2_VITVI|nr:hypothetical protein CK203_106342 [Vitis vinifera]